MADWIQTHSFISCKNHETAFLAYQAIELEKDTFDGGIRWGFWDSKTLLVCTTMRWGHDTFFLDELLEKFDLICIHENDSYETTDHIYEEKVRKILGVKEEFLWSNNEKVLNALLEKYDTYETTLTTFALFKPGRISNTFLNNLCDEASVLQGIVTDEEKAFVFGKYDGYDFNFSPLENPQIATRLAGRSWSITGALDGETIMPPNAFPQEEFWLMERHSAYGLFQSAQQRHDLILKALESNDTAEKHAGCALARRWNMHEFHRQISALKNSADLHVSATAALESFTKNKDFKEIVRERTPKETEDGANFSTWLDLDRERGKREIEKARSLIEDDILGAAARWFLVSQSEVNDRDFQKIKNASIDLFELSQLFSEKIEQPQIAESFIRRAAEIAYTITRCSYWMCRYGVPEDDYISQFDCGWNGDSTSLASRIQYWAAMVINLRTHNSNPSKRAKQSFVAMDSLLHACRHNRVFWIPALGIVQEDLRSVLTGQTHSGDPIIWTTQDWGRFEKKCKHLVELYAEMKTKEDRSEYVKLSKDALDGIPDILLVWQYGKFGREGVLWISWAANNLAWTLWEDGEPEEALRYSELAYRGANWGVNTYRDIHANILITLGRNEEAFPIIYGATARGAEELEALSQREDYQRWLRVLTDGESG